MDPLSNALYRAIAGEPGTTVELAYTDTSAATAAALTVGKVYRLCPSTDCHITMAASPTATTAHMLLGAKQQMFITAVHAYKIAAIRSSANGSLFITEMSGYRV